MTAPKAKKPAKPSVKATNTPVRITKSPELVAKIFDRVAKGESLVKICDDKDMPCRQSVFEWINTDPVVKEAYNVALAAKAEMYAEEIITIADDGSNDTYVDADGNVRTDHDVIARSRLRVDARKWVVAKLLPKKYGDRVDVTSDGEKINPVTAILMAVQGTALPVIPQGQTIDMDDDEDD